MISDILAAFRTFPFSDRFSEEPSKIGRFGSTGNGVTTLSFTYYYECHTIMRQLMALYFLIIDLVWFCPSSYNNYTSIHCFVTS